ncbi:Chloroplast thylakoid membrane [Tripterygium wilfordii]|uniref:Chloroplast thylakoid membrane n=1 Tax=Tripterygium wilfordii TaxID=458696 RepID=A0A7J7DL74_TRIWF|nr:Chloroplast thylakoid membrane [Tripterygium wilfordii]
MTSSANRLIYPATLAALSPSPPKPQISNQNLTLLHQQKNKRLQIRSDLSRRDVTSLLSLLSLVPSISQPAPATAFSIGICMLLAFALSILVIVLFLLHPNPNFGFLNCFVAGPKDWLKAQKRKASRFLLAPIDASRESLRSAYVLLTTSDYKYNDKDLEGVQRILRSASRDCVLQERNSFVEFQANTGVEVCTFQLIVNNASSLLDERDPVRLEAEDMLNDLISAFTNLNGLASKSDIQLASSRLMVADALKDTISVLNKFEQGVMACLEA